MQINNEYAIIKAQRQCKEGEFMGNTKEKISIIEYFKNLSKPILILYIISLLFFLFEAYMNLVFYNLEIPSYVDFYSVYKFLWPYIYICANLVLIFTKKINIFTLFLLFLLRIVHPDNFFFYWLFFMDAYERGFIESFKENFSYFVFEVWQERL